jgi:curved DNA-binding protein CbpA
MPDLYEELGIARDASPEEIKAAHRRKAREHHPDRGGDEEAMKRANHAVAILRDPEKRQRYDETGEESAQAKPADPITPLVLAAFEHALAALETHDPRYFDVAKAMRKWLLTQAGAGEEVNVGIRRAQEALKAVQERLHFKGEGEGPIARVIASRLQLNARNLASNEEAIRHYKEASAFVGEFLEYRADEERSPLRPEGFEADLEEQIRRMIYAPAHEFGRRGPRR